MIFTDAMWFSRAGGLTVHKAWQANRRHRQTNYSREGRSAPAKTPHTLDDFTMLVATSDMSSHFTQLSSVKVPSRSRTQRPPLRIKHQASTLLTAPATHAHTQTKDNPKAPSSRVLVTRPRVGRGSAACSACGRARHGSGSATWVGHTEDPHTPRTGDGRAGRHPHCRVSSHQPGPCAAARRSRAPTCLM